MKLRLQTLRRRPERLNSGPWTGNSTETPSLNSSANYANGMMPGTTTLTVAKRWPSSPLSGHGPGRRLRARSSPEGEGRVRNDGCLTMPDVDPRLYTTVTQQ